MDIGNFTRRHPAQTTRTLYIQHVPAPNRAGARFKPGEGMHGRVLR